MLRTRWAALGAAAAIALGGGGLGLVYASGGQTSLFVPIEPCRLLDTRPSYAVGPRTGPLGAGEILRLDVGDQDPDPAIGVGVGSCPPFDSDTSALSMNVTAIDATQDTHLTVWGTGSLPNASSLNPSRGQPPTPNSVTTELADDLSFRVFNRAGNVHVIIDVVGYFTPSAAHQITAEFGPDDFGWPGGFYTLPADGAFVNVTVVRQPIITAAPTSILIVNAAITVIGSEGHDDVDCRLVIETAGIPREWFGPWQSASLRSSISTSANMALTAGIEVPPGSHDLSAQCTRDTSGSTSVVAGGAITAIAVPTPSP